MHQMFEGVVVLGCPRSGTTLLRRLLDSHPAIACPAETNLLSAASRFLYESEFSGGLSVGVVPGLGFSGFTEEEVLGDLREFLFGYWRRILARSGKTLWAEKTAVDVFHLQAIGRLCADRCRYICIARHALDVVCSMKDLANQMDAYLPEIHHFVKQHESLSEAFAHAWCEANENMLAFVEAHPSWCCQLKYEDLVANPVDEMNRLFAFLDLDPCAQDLVDGALESAEGAGLGDWKTYEASQVHARQVGRHESLDGWTKKRLAPMVDPMLKRLDYDTVHVSDTDRQQDPLRAQELARAVAAMKMTGSSPADPDG